MFSKKCLLLQDVCDVLYVVCVFCGFVCRVLRNRAIVSKTVCKHFEKNSKNILFTPLADHFTCFKQNALNLVFPLETRLNILSHFAYLVKSWFKNF